MMLLQDSKTTRALARTQCDAHELSGMMILQDSKITRALACTQCDAHGGAA